MHRWVLEQFINELQHLLEVNHSLLVHDGLGEAAREVDGVPDDGCERLVVTIVLRSVKVCDEVGLHNGLDDGCLISW